MRQFDLNLVHVLIRPKTGILTKIDILNKNCQGWKKVDMAIQESKHTNREKESVI
jgi:hypothetical protein